MIEDNILDGVNGGLSEMPADGSETEYNEEEVIEIPKFVSLYTPLVFPAETVGLKNGKGKS